MMKILQNVRLELGVKLNITGLDDTSWVDLRRFDDQGNPIKDNQFFNITKIQDGNYYLNFENPTGLQSVFDLSHPKMQMGIMFTNYSSVK